MSPSNKFSKGFASAGEGKIPESSTLSKLFVAGKEIGPEGLGPVSQFLRDAIENGSFNPVNALVELGAMETEKIMPGGRLPEDIPDSVKAGKGKYDVVDWTVQPVPVKRNG